MASRGTMMSRRPSAPGHPFSGSRVASVVDRQENRRQDRRVARKPTAEAGAVVYRRAGDAIEVLLVGASDDPNVSMFPKGHLELGEREYDAAERELREEAGVRGRLVDAVCPPQRFGSKDEMVEVQYFVFSFEADDATDEPRRRQWTRLDDVDARLTHPEAKETFRRAVPIIWRDAQIDDSDDHRELSQDFLLSEYEHAAASLLASEQDGERRVSFFLSLAGAAVGIAVFARGDRGALEPDESEPLLALVVGVIGVLGYTTLLRVIQRNIASDQYKSGLNRIRRVLVPSPSDPRIRSLAFDPFDRPCRRCSTWRSIGRGGWLETVALVEAGLAGGFAALLIPSPSWWLDGVIAAVAAAAAWVFLIQRAARLYYPPSVAPRPG